MNFYSDIQDPAITIKNIEFNNNIFNIKYMDESESNFYCSDEKKYKEFLHKMVDQAKVRDEFENIKNLQKVNFLNQLCYVASLTGTAVSYQKGLTFIFIINFLLSTYFLKMIKDNKKRIKELKKYKIYLELIKNGNLEIPDISEFDHQYRENISINNLDEKSLSTLKYIKKHKNEIEL